MKRLTLISCSLSGRPGEACPQRGDQAALLGELDRIGEQVLQDLAQIPQLAVQAQRAPGVDMQRKQ